MSKKSNGENYQEYLKKHNRFNLPIPQHEESIDELMAEGFKLLAEEERIREKAIPSNVKAFKKIDAPVPAAPKKPINPYVKAREEILGIWNSDPNMKWRATEIAEMESGKIPKTKHYDDFVHDVAILGDKLSNKS